MATREEIIAELQKVPEQHLDEVYRLIKRYEANAVESDENDNVMAKLRGVKISASPDFSLKANLCDLEERNAG